ncbi:MAG: hypothetical protein KA319_06380 [Ferruginibacter sp.]|nr:hypothetical protein [Ferruginibacter sp.]
MKKCLLILAAVFCLVAIGFAQPTSESQRGAYSVSQVRQARENAEMNRHYESLKPSTPYKSTSGTYSSSFEIPKLFTLKEDRKKEAAIKAENEKLIRNKNKFISLVRERSDLDRTYNNYETFKSIGSQAGLNESTILNLIGKDANEYMQMAFNNYTLVGSCYVIKLNTNSSAASNNYDYRSFQQAQDFNSYLKQQNSNQPFNSFTENTSASTILEPLPFNNQNVNNNIVLQGLNTEMVNSSKKTQVLEGLMLDNHTSNSTSQKNVAENSFSVDRSLFLQKSSFSIDTNNNRTILESLKFSPQNKNTSLPVLKPLNQNNNQSTPKNNSILESLKIQDNKPTKENSIYKKLINLE